MGNVSFEERLKRLGLTPLLARMQRGDMIKIFKIVIAKVDFNSGTWFNLLPSRYKVQQFLSYILLFLVSVNGYFATVDNP